MTTLEEVADILNGTLQEDTQYRGQYVIEDAIASFNITGLALSDYVTELLDGLNESEDGQTFIFAFAKEGAEGEFINVTKK